MSVVGSNIPLVIQQSGDVARLAEVAGRSGEQQQLASAEQVAQEQIKQKQQVTNSQESDAQNRMDREKERERRKKAREQLQKQRRAAAGQPEEAKTAGRAVGRGVVDITV